ncbi:tripartite motif-containing protein 2-like [Dysidea avara]|uniref:tripartite motif-containing protein 2-like n=1 Tax=Dysidea avara TaxID=196820 RepID=UPI0033303EFC
MAAVPLGGGYEYQFVAAPPDWLICNICHYPSREPYLSVCCGHTFCKSCLEGAKRATSISDACPICRNIQFVTNAHQQADRAIRSLHVICTNKEKGCQWQDEVNKIASHIKNSDGCQFEDVACPNDCGMCVQRQHLTGHIEDECIYRKVDCQQHEGSQTQISKGKDELNDRLGYIERDVMAINRKFEVIHQTTNLCHTHLMQWCILITLIALLVYLQVQVNESFNHNLLLKDDIQISKKEVKLVQKELSIHKNATNRMNEAIASQQEANKIIDELAQKLANTQRELNTTKQQLAIACHNLTKAEKEHTTLAANTDEVLSQLETKFQMKITEIDTAAEKNITKLETKLEQKNGILKDVLLMNNEIWMNYIKYSAAKTLSGDQVVPVIMRVPDYLQRWRNTFVSELTVGSFYTHYKGCKIHLSAKYVVSSILPSLTLHMNVMKGPYDDQLCSPMILKQNFRITLLNQINNSEHKLSSCDCHVGCSQKVQDGELVNYFDDICSVDIVFDGRATETIQYLKDDSIFLEIDFELN